MLFAIRFELSRHRRKLIWAYRSVFAASPWNEFLWCKQCGKIGAEKSITTRTSRTCPKCLQTARYYHNSRDITQRAMHGDCILLMQMSKVTGFVWGWQTNPTDLAATLGHHHINVTVEALEEFIGPTAAFYVDDLGVLPEVRGGFLAITQLLYTILRSRNEELVVFWTDRNSNLFKLAENIAAFLTIEGTNLVVGKIPRAQLVRMILMADSKKRKILRRSI